MTVLLGPISAFLALLAAFQASLMPLYLLVPPLLLLCHFLKRKGFYVAILSLAIMPFVLPLNHPMILFFLLVSFAIALFTTTLTAEELHEQQEKNSGDQQIIRQKLYQAENQLNLLQSQLEEKKNQLSQKCTELDETKALAISTKEKLSNSTEQLHKEKKNHEYARALIKDQEKNIKEISSQIEGLAKSKKNLEEDLDKLAQEIEAQKKQNKQLNDQLQNALAQQHGERLIADQERKKAKEEITVLSKDRDSAHEQATTLKQDKEELSKRIELLIDEKMALEEKLTNSERKLDAYIPPRRLQAMYDQLREQFDQKSDLLQKTRKELFHTQEKLLAFQKEWDENQLFDQDKQQAAMDSHITKLEKEFNDYACEISDLHNLISSLIKEKK